MSDTERAATASMEAAHIAETAEPAVPGQPTAAGSSQAAQPDGSRTTPKPAKAGRFAKATFRGQPSATANSQPTRSGPADLAVPGQPIATATSQATQSDGANPTPKPAKAGRFAKATVPGRPNTTANSRPPRSEPAKPAAPGQPIAAAASQATQSGGTYSTPKPAKARRFAKPAVPGQQAPTTAANSRPTRSGPANPTPRASAAAALTLLAALAFHRILPLGPLLAATGTGVLAALASGLLARRRGWPLAAAAVATAVLWLPAACVTIGLSAGSGGDGPTPSISSLTRVLRGAGAGWARVLTTVPPLGPDPAVLAAVSALAALAAFGAVQTAIRTEAVLPVAAPGFVVLVLGLLATGPGSDLPVAVAFAVATAALTAVAAAPATGSIARYAAALPAVAGVCAVSLLSATTASGRPPFDPRTLVTPPPATRPAVDPLQQVAAWVGTPQTRLFTIDTSTSTSTDTSASPATGSATASATTAPDLRLTVLDHFDGGAWSSDAVYTATGSRIPASAAVENAPTTDLRQDIRIDQLNTLWLPAPARPTTVTALDNRLTVDGDGELLIPDGTKPGLHYTVTARVPQYSEAALRGAVPVADPVATALPGDVPPIIAQTAQDATAGAGFPYQQAARLADYLRTTAVYDPTAPAGDGYGHIAYFLGTSHRGGSDQFAVAFALMARSLGLPTRVAVGFAPSAPHAAGADGATGAASATGAAADTATGRTTVAVTGADALAWPEVDFAGLGWVPFFPTPSGPGRGGALHLASGESAVRQSVDDTLTGVKLPAPQPLPANDFLGAPTGSDVRSSGSSGLSIAVLVFVCSISLITAYLGYALGIPQLRRRRRRRAPDPAAAVLGAWWETVTMLRTLGLETVGTRTTAQIAAFGADRLGADGARALTALARLADHAAFAPATSGVTGAAAVQAWSGYAAVRGAVRATVPRRTRLLHGLIPPSPLPPRKV